MTDEPTAEEMDAVQALLNDPSLWAEPSPGVEDQVLAAISAERSAAGHQPIDPAVLDEIDPPGAPIPFPTSTTPPGIPVGADGSRPFRAGATAGSGGEVVDLASRRGWRTRMLPLAAAAAVVVAALAAFSVFSLGGDGEIETLALAGSENAAGASAVAEIEHLANGDRIVLRVADLPPAPEGSFYAAWVIEDDPALRVGAGTFHMRGGDGEIELWSGVSTETYTTLSVTLQSIDDPAGPGTPMLKGTLGSP